MLLLHGLQEDELKSRIISVRIAEGVDDNYWDSIMMDVVLVATCGHIGVGLDSSNTCLAVRIVFPHSIIDLAQEMDRFGEAT